MHRFNCCSDDGYSRVRNISRVIELENGTLTVTDYTSFLETPVVVTGAVLASTGTFSPGIGYEGYKCQKNRNSR